MLCIYFYLLWIICLDSLSVMEALTVDQTKSDQNQAGPIIFDQSNIYIPCTHNENIPKQEILEQAEEQKSLKLYENPIYLLQAENQDLMFLNKETEITEHPELPRPCLVIEDSIQSALHKQHSLSLDTKKLSSLEPRETCIDTKDLSEHRSSLEQKNLKQKPKLEFLNISSLNISDATKDEPKVSPVLSNSNAIKNSKENVFLFPTPSDNKEENKETESAKTSFIPGEDWPMYSLH